MGLQGEQLLQAGQMWALSPFPELSGAVLSCFTSLSASSAGLVSSRGLCFYFLMDEHLGSCAGPSLGSSLSVLKLCCAVFKKRQKKRHILKMFFVRFCNSVIVSIPVNFPF